MNFKTNEFKTAYENATDKIKLAFLDGITVGNQDLQKAFVTFAASNEQPSGITYERFCEIVVQVLEDYKNRFEEVDPENPDWEKYSPSGSGYMEEWEQYQEASEQEFDEVFDEFKTEATDRIIMQKLDELIAMIIGLYEATLEADINDPYDSFGDVNEYLLREHSRVMHEIIEKVNLSAVSDSAVINVCKTFFMYCDNEYPGNEHFTAYFEDLLLVISGKSSHPGKILTILDHSNAERKYVPRLVLMLHQKAGNSEEWLQTARQFYAQNNNVAGQLLEHYFCQGNPEFTELAKELFEKDPRYWAQQLKRYVTAEMDEALFAEVFFRLVVDEGNLEDFHKLRPHLSTEKLEKLISDIHHDKPFLVQVLAVEERYEEIKEIVEHNPNDWQYPELITPLLEVFPEFCFNHISEKARRTIQTERGRSTYLRIVEWLQLAARIPGYYPQTMLLAREFYNHKPNLPALKDELRQAGLV